LVFLFLGYRSFGTKTLTKQEAKSNLLWKRCPTGGWVGVELPEAAEGFAPLKNPPGSASDSVEHVQAALVAHARRLLAKAGVAVAEGVDVELAANRIIDETDIAGLPIADTVIDRPLVIGG
jgi:hypothetical protein